MQRGGGGGGGGREERIGHWGNCRFPMLPRPIVNVLQETATRIYRYAVGSTKKVAEWHRDFCLLFFFSISFPASHSFCFSSTFSLPTHVQCSYSNDVQPGHSFLLKTTFCSKPTHFIAEQSFPIIARNGDLQTGKMLLTKFFRKSYCRLNRTMNKGP